MKRPYLKHFVQKFQWQIRVLFVESVYQLILGEKQHQGLLMTFVGGQVGQLPKLKRFFTQVEFSLHHAEKGQKI